MPPTPLLIFIKTKFSYFFLCCCPLEKTFMTNYSFTDFCKTNFCLATIFKLFVSWQNKASQFCNYSVHYSIDPCYRRPRRDLVKCSFTRWINLCRLITDVLYRIINVQACENSQTLEKLSKTQAKVQANKSVKEVNVFLHLMRGLDISQLKSWLTNQSLWEQNTNTVCYKMLHQLLLFI